MKQIQSLRNTVKILEHNEQRLTKETQLLEMQNRCCKSEELKMEQKFLALMKERDSYLQRFEES